MEAATPWLVDLGKWIFGALIGFDLLMLAALLTVGPVDRAVLISTAAFALGLPPEVCAFVLLRLVRDLESSKIEQVAAQSLADAGLAAYMPAASLDQTDRLRRRTASALGVSYTLLFFSVASALVGLSATLWHMGWWLAVAFIGIVVLSVALVYPVIARPGKPGARGDAAPAGTGPGVH